MRSLLKHPLVRVLVIATTVAMCSMALRETASITLPIIKALKEVLIPVAIGFTIAYVLTPVVDGMTNRLHIPRAISAGMFFGLSCLIAVLLIILVVPTVARQSTSMAERVFKGEVYTDINANGRYDDGEPYRDANGNNRYDANGMFASALEWIEERQGQLRQFAQLELDRPSRAVLLLYLDETAPERIAIDNAIAAVRDNRPIDTWPPQVRAEPAPDAPVAWDDSWPGLSRAQFEEAYNRVPPELRERWARNVEDLGESYATKHAAVLAALRLVRTGGEIPDDPATQALCERVRDAFQQKPTPERDQQAQAFAARLVDEEINGGAAARDLLNELRGGDQSAQWLGPVVKKLETEVNSQLESLPSKLGSWATSGITSVNDVLTIALDFILVPIYAFFLILAMPAIRRGVKNYLPEYNRPQLIRIMREIEVVVAAFFRGRLIVCVICAVLVYIGFLGVGLTGTGVPYAVLFSLLIGLATAVPLAGLLFLVPAVIMAGLDGGSAVTITLIIVVYTVVQVLETVVLTPTIMGHEVELHPVTLIIALLLCGKLLGILGLILAVPIAATFRILAREFFFPWLSNFVTTIRPRLRTPFDDET